MKSIPVRHIIPSSNESVFSGRFKIRDLQEVLTGQDLAHDLHRHDFFFILALQQAMGIHEIDFIQYEVHDQSIFFLRPGQVHKLQLRAGCTGFLMELDLSFYQPKNTITDQRWKKASRKNYCEAEATKFVKLHTILANVFNEFTTKQEGYVEAIKANLDLFFIEYVRQSRNPKSIPKTDNAYTQDRFEELVNLLETNICSMKNVSPYADLLSLSSYQLNAITKASVGKTVSDLINEQILLEAKRYLLAISMQIKEVADQIGYEDVSYFIRFFKKHTGFSPETFRNNFK